MVGVHSVNKLPVVLDVGTAYTKVGYAGDDAPMCIIPSRMDYITHALWFRDIDLKDVELLKATLRDFLRQLYLRQLLVSMNERSVIICESPFSPTVWRDTLASILLIDFNVPSVVFGPRHLLSLYTLGLQTALVINSGYSETSVLPIYESTVLLNCCETAPLAGQAIESNILDRIKSSGKLVSNEEATPITEQAAADILTSELLENIRARCCCVTRFDRAQQYHNDNLPTPPPEVKYPITESRDLIIPGELRETACEILYNQDTCEQTLASMVLESLLLCPRDTRKVLADNIVIIGGSANMPGFKHRLMKELYHLIEEKSFSSRLSVKSFRFHENTTANNISAWLGGSILGSSGNLEAYAFSRDQFVSNNKTVPDWSSYELNDQSKSRSKN